MHVVILGPISHALTKLNADASGNVTKARLVRNCALFQVYVGA